MATRKPYERKIPIGLPSDVEYQGHLKETGHLVFEITRFVDPDTTTDVKRLIHSCVDSIEALLKDTGHQLNPGVDLMGAILEAFQNAVDLSFIMESMTYRPDVHNPLIPGPFPDLREHSKAARDRVGSAFTEKD